MALWQGHLQHAELEVGAELSTPVAAYLMLDPGGSGRYVLGSGNPLTEAKAFLKASPIGSAPDRFVLDSDPAEEDRTPFLVGADRVVI